MDDSRRAESLASLERKLHVLYDHVTAVAKQYKTGLFVYGPGGVGKSFAVLRHLQSLEADYKLFNSRMTAKGLFITLKTFLDKIHVLEDMERLTKDADAQGVLRSALWCQPGHERKVTWTTATNKTEDFSFAGGIIMISNRPLADLPELRALATRIEVLHMDVTDAELEAHMLHLASQGYRRGGQTVMEPSECVVVTNHLLQECRRGGCLLDLRLQQKCFQTYLQWEAHHTACHWKDLVAASVREAAHHFAYEPETASREERLVAKRNIIREILKLTTNAKEQEAKYREQTGAGRADYYRRKREVESGEFEGETG